MTEVPQSPAKIIVVAEEEAYNLLRDSGVYWNPQHRVESVGQMWDDLSGQRLDQQSVALVFSDTTFAAPGELEAAIAAMASYAATFVIAWHPENIEALRAGVAQAATMNGTDPNAPVYFLDPASKQGLLDTMRQVLADRIWFPEDYSIDTTGPLVVLEAAPPVFEHSAPEPVPVPVPAAVAEPAYAAAPAPVAEPVYAPAPVAQPVYAPAPVAEPVYAPAPTAQPAYAPAPAVNGYEETTGEKPVRPGQVTLAVTSSKGGSGKSTTAMMIAAQIAHSSQKAFEAGLVAEPLKVCLVDMDTRDGQVASLIGRYVPTALNIRVSPQWDEKTIIDNLVHDPKLGIDALLAPVRPRTADDVGPDFYRHVIRTLKTTHDVVIMDTSVNYLDPLIANVCLPEATAILFVTTLATTSIQGMARALREITEPVEHGGMGIKRTKIGIVVNQSITEVGMDRDQVVQAALRVSIVGAIPLATKDVLTCTNFNRMHQLLKHPLLGPAYYKLAKTCLPNAQLLPVTTEAGGTSATATPAPITTPTHGAPVPAGVAPAPVAAAPAPAAADGKKRGLFGRKG